MKQFKSSKKTFIILGVSQDLILSYSHKGERKVYQKNDTKIGFKKMLNKIGIGVDSYSQNF